jgi:serine/threonine protein kinase
MTDDTKTSNFIILAEAGKKVFAIWVASGNSIEFLIALLQNKVCDSSLDTARAAPRRLNDSLLPKGLYENESLVFMRHQDDFLVEDILFGVFKQTLESGLRLPLHLEPGTSKGTTAEVYMGKIDEAYFYHKDTLLTGQVSEGMRLVAVKNYRRNASPAVKADQDREIKFILALHRLKINNHEHITKSFAEFSLENGIRCLLSERADMNLEQFLASHTSVPKATWLRTQMRGLAKALAAIHVPAANMSGLHHDIKPANILVFVSDNNRLKLTDWGCGQIEERPRANGGELTSKRYGNPPYLPPECDYDGPTSRKHDIWSLGCVFFELLIWFTGGLQRYNDFHDARRKTPGQQFYVKNDAQIVTHIPPLRDELISLSEKEAWTTEASVVKAMLDVSPESRLDAKKVVERLG